MAYTPNGTAQFGDGKFASACTAQVRSRRASHRAAKPAAGPSSDRHSARSGGERGASRKHAGSRLCLSRAIAADQSLNRSSSNWWSGAESNHRHADSQSATAKLRLIKDFCSSIWRDLVHSGRACHHQNSQRAPHGSILEKSRRFSHPRGYLPAVDAFVSPYHRPAPEESYSKFGSFSFFETPMVYVRPIQATRPATLRS
jgi:hypothetical protein